MSLEGFRNYVESDEPDSYRWYTFEVDEYRVCVLVKVDSQEDALLTEAQQRGTPLGGRYSAVKHSAHTPQGRDHLHVYARQNQLFALNVDGTAHDQSHQTRIPNKVAAAIKARFPEFTVPDNNFIESVDPNVQRAVNMKILSESIE
jgi:hypothetical protein